MTAEFKPNPSAPTDATILQILDEILFRLKDIHQRAARTETRIMRLADELAIDITKPAKGVHHVS